MKKIFKNIFLIALFAGLTCLTAHALTFSEGIEATSHKPLMVLLYADWDEDYQAIEENFDKIENAYGNKYNYVKVNIATKDFKDFNSRFELFPNIPYIMIYKNNGKISRYVKNSCAKDYSCIDTMVKNFLD